MFYFKTEDNLTVVFENGNILTFSKNTKELYDRVYNLCTQKNWIKIESLANMTNLVIENGKFKCGNVVIETDEGDIDADADNDLVKFIKVLNRKGIVGEELKVIRPFLEKVFANQYIDCLRELYDFCEAGDFGITDTGNIIAYKHVRGDMKSCYDKTTKHEIGERMFCFDFSTDRKQVCSKGLHFCSYEYLSSYPGEITLLVEIDPRDIVSIPVDYNFTKGRARAYTPVAIIPENAMICEVDLYDLAGIKLVKTSNKEEDCEDDNRD